MRLPSQAVRMAWIAQQLDSLEGHGIIYTLTIRDANQLADWLKTRGFSVEAYTGKTGDRREELEQALQENQVKALVATTALGMGYDKPDLAFVIHYQMPGSVVAYYQQVGRAGRALESAYGVLLSGDEEEGITDWFIRSAFPTPREVDDVLGALNEADDGLSIPELMTCVNMSKSRIEKTITALSLESPAPIAKQQTKWQLTAAKLGEGFWARADRLTRLRRGELQQMQEYVGLEFGKHMGFLIDALDGDSSNVSPPSLPPLSEEVTAGQPSGALRQESHRGCRQAGDRAQRAGDLVGLVVDATARVVKGMAATRLVMRPQPRTLQGREDRLAADRRAAAGKHHGRHPALPGGDVLAVTVVIAKQRQGHHPVGPAGGKQLGHRKVARTFQFDAIAREIRRLLQSGTTQNGWLVGVGLVGHDLAATGRPVWRNPTRHGSSDRFCRPRQYRSCQPRYRP